MSRGSGCGSYKGSKRKRCVRAVDSAATLHTAWSLTPPLCEHGTDESSTVSMQERHSWTLKGTPAPISTWYVLSFLQHILLCTTFPSIVSGPGSIIISHHSISPLSHLSLDLPIFQIQQIEADRPHGLLDLI
jgi:hypothetical protein